MLSIGILRRFEKELEGIEDVLEDIVGHQLALHTLWQFCKCIRVLIDGSEAIISPVELKMIVDLLIQRFR